MSLTEYTVWGNYFFIGLGILFLSLSLLARHKKLLTLAYVVMFSGYAAAGIVAIKEVKDKDRFIDIATKHSIRMASVIIALGAIGYLFFINPFFVFIPVIIVNIASVSFAGKEINKEGV